MCLWCVCACGVCAVCIRLQCSLCCAYAVVMTCTVLLYVTCPAAVTLGSPAHDLAPVMHARVGRFRQALAMHMTLGPCGHRAYDLGPH